eukprot:2414323-Amphidinium_carterae.1
MQLLVELDGFEDSQRYALGTNLSYTCLSEFLLCCVLCSEDRAEILLVAATNRSDVLDPALLRAGRLERRVVLETPDQAAERLGTAGRQDILDLYCSKKPLDADVDLAEVAFSVRVQAYWVES